MTGGWFDYQSRKLFVSRSGYTGEDGFEVSILNDLVENFTQNLIDSGAELIGLGARDTLRLEAGLCLYGHDLDLNKTPIEANLKWAHLRFASIGVLFKSRSCPYKQSPASNLKVSLAPSPISSAPLSIKF